MHIIALLNNKNENKAKEEGLTEKEMKKKIGHHRNMQIRSPNM